MIRIFAGKNYDYNSEFPKASTSKFQFILSNYSLQLFPLTITTLHTSSVGERLLNLKDRNLPFLKANKAACIQCSALPFIVLEVMS